MSKYIPGNQKHLSLEDRIYIENELNKGETFKNIARFLCKDPTTISKEVRLTVYPTGITKVLSIMPITLYSSLPIAGKTNVCGKINSLAM